MDPSSSSFLLIRTLSHAPVRAIFFSIDRGFVEEGENHFLLVGAGVLRNAEILAYFHVVTGG